MQVSRANPRQRATPAGDIHGDGPIFWPQRHSVSSRKQSLSVPVICDGVSRTSTNVDSATAGTTPVLSAFQQQQLSLEPLSNQRTIRQGFSSEFCSDRRQISTLLCLVPSTGRNWWRKCHAFTLWITKVSCTSWRIPSSLLI